MVGGEVLAHRPFGCRLAISGSSRFGNLGLHARSNSHSVVARGELHQDSACGGQAREDEAILRCGFARPCNPSVRPPGSAEADRASAIGFPREEARSYAALFITAPSITTPTVTYFHRATSSLRASATMAVLRPRWLCALNQRASADCPWCRSHSQASWIIVLRSRGLPALDTPCSCSMLPLRHGVGARPA